MSATKPSGIPWLGEVPAHWEVKRLRFVVQKIGSGKTPKGGAESYATEGVVFIRSQNVYDDGLRLDDVVYIDDETDEDMAGTRVKPNDVLLNITGASIGRCAPVPDDLGPANVNQHVAIIRPEREKVDQRFLHAFLCSQATKAAILADEVGSSREALNFEQIAGLPIPLPPLPEQRAIAAFLDERTARIDALVARKRRLVQLLKEKRQALITRAVTRGLDPKAKMKESGVPWLGEVPEGWGIQKFGRVVSITEGQVNPEVEPYMDMLLIAPNHIESRSGKLLAQETAAEQAAESGKYLCPEGAVIYSKIRPALRKATIAPEACLCSADMYPMVGIHGMTNGYLLWLLLSEAFSDWVVLDSDRVAMPKVNRETLNAYWLPLPPVNEQEAIVTYIAEQTTRLDALVTKVEQAVERLQEYRTALISAAVTGKVPPTRGASADKG